MYSLENYLNTSAEDAKISLERLLDRNPQTALLMAENIIIATSSLSHKKTLHKTACIIKKKARKLIEEAENNLGSHIDIHGNLIEFVATPEHGLIEFTINGEPFTEWCYEDEPESQFLEFLKIWNKAQAQAKSSAR